MNLVNLGSDSVISFFSFRDFDSLREEEHAANLQLAFDVSEREFGFRPFTSVAELHGGQEPDKTKMITYLSKFYELFRGTPLPASGSSLSTVALWGLVLFGEDENVRAFVCSAGSRGADENNRDYLSKHVRSNNFLNLASTRKRVPKVTPAGFMVATGLVWLP